MIEYYVTHDENGNKIRKFKQIIHKKNEENNNFKEYKYIKYPQFLK